MSDLTRYRPCEHGKNGPHAKMGFKGTVAVETLCPGGIPDSTLQDIADAYTAFIVISDRGGTASLEAKLAFAKVLTTLDTLVDIAVLDALEGTDNE